MTDRRDTECDHRALDGTPSDEARWDQTRWDEARWDQAKLDEAELDEVELDEVELEVAEQDFERLAALIARIDPVPDHVVAAARAALSLRALDGELATLVSDSAAEPLTAAVRGEPLATPRGEPEIRLLSFEASGARLDVEVSGRSGGFRIVAQVAGSGADYAVVEDGCRERELPVDESGRFRVDGLTGGRVRLRFLTADGATVATSWISL